MGDTIDQMITMFPEEMLKAFNMDKISISTAFGWLATEGYMFITLACGAYFSILGGSILLKETDDGTIDFLYSKPVSKNKIVTSKLIAGLIYTIALNLIVGLVILIALQLTEKIMLTKWLLFTLAPTLLSIFFFTLGLFYSNFFKKTNHCLAIGMGAVFGTFLFNMMASLSDKLELLKYLSPFYYMDCYSIVESSSLDIGNIMIMITASAIFSALTYLVYNKKELGK